MTRGLVAAPLGQVTVLSLMKVTAVLRGPQYPITSTSFWLHSPLHAAPVQSRRTTRVAFSAVPGGPGGPAGPGSPFSPGGPTAPGSPFGPSPHPDAQMDNAIATAIPLMFITHPLHFFRCQHFSRNVRHKRTIGHPLLEVLEHAGFSNGQSGPGSGHRGSALGASGTAKPRACSYRWERGVIAGLAVT
jgi:hypothetical protein